MLLDEVGLLSRVAGEAIMDIYNKSGHLDIKIKPDCSPVTEADLIANDIIISELSRLTPDIPILSEECLVDWEIRRHWQRYWLIDPLDGTKDFIQRTGDFTVNIALIDNGNPVMGVIYAPVVQSLYLAENSSDKKTAWKQYKGVCSTIQSQSSSIPTVVTSRSSQGNKLEQYLTSLGPYQRDYVGSSLKFCLLAEGKAQIYPRFGDTSIWDTAAGQVILCASGGKVIDWQGNSLTYHPKPSLINPPFCALSE